VIIKRDTVCSLSNQSFSIRTKKERHKLITSWCHHFARNNSTKLSVRLLLNAINLNYNQPLLQLPLLTMVKSRSTMKTNQLLVLSITCLILAQLMTQSVGSESSFIARLRPRREVNYCSRSQPCGWLVYVQHTRVIDYHVRSPCSCPSETARCVRTADDVGINAYVYHCRNDSEATGRDELPAGGGSTSANETAG